jgi:hypothetical protein
MMRVFVFVFTASMLLQNGRSAGQSESALATSTLRLVAMPQSVDGRVVDVVGVLTIGPEAGWLYVTNDDAKNVVRSNAIFVDYSEDIGRRRAELNRKYVRLFARFHAGPYRHGTSVSDGVLTEIQNASIYSDPLHPLSEVIDERLGLKNRARDPQN